MSQNGLRDTIDPGRISFRNHDQIETADSLLQKLGNAAGYEEFAPVATGLDLLCRERLLQEKSRIDLDTFDPRDCLAFVFEAGEDPVDRCTTRLGGLPYWPRQREWPKAQDGSPKQFVGQIDFRNVIWPERLPGDLVTIHFDFNWEGDGRFYGPADGEAATLTWFQSGLSIALVEKNDLPPPNEIFGEIGPFCSTPVRVCDYKPSRRHTTEDENSLSFNCYTIHGTKIGGHSPLYGDNWDTDFPADFNPVFLFSIGSIRDPQTRLCPMPARAGFDESNAWGVCWLDMGVLVVCHEQGNPSHLRWGQYLP